MCCRPLRANEIEHPGQIRIYLCARLFSKFCSWHIRTCACLDSYIGRLSIIMGVQRSMRDRAESRVPSSHIFVAPITLSHQLGAHHIGSSTGLLRSRSYKFAVSSVFATTAELQQPKEVIRHFSLASHRSCSFQLSTRRAS